MKIFIPILLFYSSFLFARGPAVEPIFGISIEEQLAVSPEKSKGFNFISTNQEKEYGTLEKSNLEQLILLLIFLISMPLLFFIFLNLNKKSQDKDKYLEILEKYPKNSEEDRKKAS
jgi:hypothetical protein